MNSKMSKAHSKARNAEPDKSELMLQEVLVGINRLLTSSRQANSTGSQCSQDCRADHSFLHTKFNELSDQVHDLDFHIKTLRFGKAEQNDLDVQQDQIDDWKCDYDERLNAAYDQLDGLQHVCRQIDEWKCDYDERLNAAQDQLDDLQHVCRQLQTALSKQNLHRTATVPTFDKLDTVSDDTDLDAENKIQTPPSERTIWGPKPAEHRRAASLYSEVSAPSFSSYRQLSDEDRVGDCGSPSALKKNTRKAEAGKGRSGQRGRGKKGQWVLGGRVPPPEATALATKRKSRQHAVSKSRPTVNEHELGVGRG